MSKPKKKKLTQREKNFRDKWNAEWRLKQNTRKKELFESVTFEQRKRFIEALRDGETWSTAMKRSSIEDISVAYIVYQKNSKPLKLRALVSPEKVR